ncbi:unnamed protein product [Ilex paraguariensis]|uniref:Uncharacterized protein n=1 Tax=Ilex paraguariensis TaxID=185542 RepID=A0ABC8RNA5_9AQUA
MLRESELCRSSVLWLHCPFGRALSCRVLPPNIDKKPLKEFRACKAAKGISTCSLAEETSVWGFP